MANSEIDLLELIERLRRIGTDTQNCEVKEAGRKLPESLPETISAFANKEGGGIVLGLSERENFSPVPGFDRNVGANLRLQSRVKPTFLRSFRVV